jgi:hypothetical protein
MSPVVAANPLAAASLTKHILEHVRIKAEEQVEAQIFEAYGPENKDIVSDIQKEAQVALLVAQGMSELRQLSQELSGEGAPDPLVKLKEQEIQLRAQADERKAQTDAQRLQLDAQDQAQSAQEAQQRLATTQAIAAEKADIARARLAQSERKQNAP